MTQKTSKLLRVLIVDDDPIMRETYRGFFEDFHSGEFSVTTAADGEQALQILNRETMDLLVLDWVLPGISGSSLAKTLREKALTRSLGILMVTGKTSPSETVLALESGADDFLSKPFDWNVLLARLRSLARRKEIELDRRVAKRLPGLEFDFEAERLTIDGAEIRLSPKELGLLKVFIAHPNILHTQTYLWQSAWGYESPGWVRTLLTTLSSLRGKLGKKWGAKIVSHKGRGYIFES